MLGKATIRRRRQRGQTTIEMALMVIIVLTVVFWIFEICNLIYTYTVISDAAHEGVRYAVVHTGVVANDPNVQARVQTFAGMSMHNVSAISTSVSFPDGSNTPPNRVRVTVSYAYVPYLSEFMSNPPTMSAYAEGRMIVE